MPKRLGVPEMTARINELRAIDNASPVSQQWVRLICKERQERESAGLPYLPAIKLDPRNSQSPFVCDEAEFEKHLADIVKMRSAHGRPKKATSSPRGPERARARTTPPIIKIRDVYTRVLGPVLNVPSPRTVIEGLNPYVLKLITGREICEQCLGVGCEMCDGSGWRT